MDLVTYFDDNALANESTERRKYEESQEKHRHSTATMFLTTSAIAVTRLGSKALLPFLAP